MFKIGTKVYCAPLKKYALIVEGPNNKGEYLVGTGAIKIWLNSNQFNEAQSESKGIIKRKKSDPPSKKPIKEVQKLDLHGMTVRSSLEALEKAIDRALLEGTAKIEAMHGLGSGKVKDAVHKYLSHSKHVEEYFLDPSNPGVTWIML